jgi:taurine transport system substrate-binding protein
MRLANTAWGLAVGAALAFGGVALAQDKPEEITVAYFLEWPTPNQVAQVNDTYSEEMGVKVNWRAFGNGNEMTQAMASGDVQIAYSQGLPSFVVAHSTGFPLRLVGIAVSYAAADNCVVRDDSGITAENAKELEGKKVATPVGNVTHYKLLRMLQHLGVDPTKVEIVQMNGADAAVAFARGDVVMGCAFGGPMVRMLESGGHLLMSLEEQQKAGIRVFDVITVTDEFAKEHPDLVKKFMEITSRANADYAANPDQYLETISKAAGMDLPATKDMLGMFAFPTPEEQKSADWFGGGLQKYTKEVADFFVEQGQIDKALDDYSPYIDPSFLP